MKIYLNANIEELLHAARQVLRGDPAAGVDKTTGATFRVGLDGRLHRMRRQLHVGTYRLSRLRRIRVNTKSGKHRELQIPVIQDRIVARVLLDRLASVDRQLPGHVLCRRDGIGQHQAIKIIDSKRVELPWALELDIKDAFSAADADVALAALAERCQSLPVINAVNSMMHAACRQSPGLPQGHPLSQLLLGLYLAPLDQVLVDANGLSYRYVDDIIVLARTEAEVVQARQSLESVLGELGMVAHPHKTRIVAPRKALPFLGWEVNPDGAVDASQRAVDTLVEALLDKAHETQRAHLRGWLAHFAAVAPHGKRVMEIYSLLKSVPGQPRFRAGRVVDRACGEANASTAGTR